MTRAFPISMRALRVSALGFLIAGLASAAPLKLSNLPVTVEPNEKLLTLTPAGIRSAFPSAAGRPGAVFMTEDRKVSVALEWRAGKLAPNEVEKLVAQFPAVIRAQVPGVKALKADLVQLGGRSWAQFIFTTPGQGDDLRRELLMTSAGGRILVMTIAGNVRDYSRNEALIRNFAGNVRVN
ncbi:hypothetical protein [Deinococcus radiodurans]|jgi:hypothetical protein|uniref:PsbP C-terminal domain-containing protein n=2 Tax=Deinococcus radiodurans TaxID=1299 RepID=Q9RUY8_DEIRA|nr:hypothetical protein [Deinococcus radiodurans]AAF10821.1 hypothetical protein DR_1242 [Deinococcus radiodurans R1 = ATCC 13939 = DSM 20539]ANC71594.1 hypothetical protein A2G07_07315 [Deinococcus radiodurans R1 = ATCC 13939 = DSM 20539]QEM70715.1 hypothetical protein DXG80_02370 [Deinococcus radiodurans]UDL00366.1 hypothetical protein E5E91_06455 [Deinococcus radiodurans R1 = ATCC 13939 = DSM 20539]HCE65648.1 hypothetical protein [Deinococcus radiodurans]